MQVPCVRKLRFKGYPEPIQMGQESIRLLNFSPQAPSRIMHRGNLQDQWRDSSP